MLSVLTALGATLDAIALVAVIFDGVKFIAGIEFHWPVFALIGTPILGVVAGLVFTDLWNRKVKAREKLVAEIEAVHKAFRQMMPNYYTVGVEGLAQRKIEIVSRRRTY